MFRGRVRSRPGLVKHETRTRGDWLARPHAQVSGLTDDDAVIDANWTSHLEELFRAAPGNDKLEVDLKKLQG